MHNEIATYIARGWVVLPGVQGSKHPRGKWRDCVEPYPAEHWQKNPDDIVCLLTGERSNVVVLDIDPRNLENNAQREKLQALCTDSPQGLQAALRALNWPEPAAASRTPGGGVHLFYRRTGPLQTAANLTPGVDLRAEGGIVVVPPSRRGVKRYRWVKPWKGEIRNGPPKWVNEWQEQNSTVRPAARPASDGWIQTLLAGSVAEGARNQTLTRFAGYLVGRGLPVELVQRLVSLANANLSNPLPASEIDSISNSIASREKRRDLGLTTLEDLYLQSGPLSWVVDQWLPSDTIAILAADPGSFKTWLVLDLAISVALGVRFCGHRCRQGRVLLFQQEDPYSGIAERMSTILAAKSLAYASADSVRFPATPDIDVVTARDFTFQEKGWIRSLETAIQDRRPSIVVIDPLYAVTSQEDWMRDAANLMRPLKQFRDEYHTSFVIAHHTSGELDLSRKRIWGSTFINAFAETVWMVGKAKQDATIVVQRYMKRIGQLPPVMCKFDIDTRVGNYRMTSESITDEQVTSMLVPPDKAMSVKDTVYRYLHEHGAGDVASIATDSTLSVVKVAETLVALKRSGLVTQRKDRRWELTVQL